MSAAAWSIFVPTLVLIVGVVDDLRARKVRNWLSITLAVFSALAVFGLFGGALVRPARDAELAAHLLQRSERHAERCRRVRLRHSEKALDHSEVDLDGATPFFGKGLVAGLPSREQVYAQAVRRGHVYSLPWHACGGAVVRKFLARAAIHK